MRLRRDQPFVGRSAFAHKGGMHAHAIARAVNSYEHLDPAVVGNERRILISELSGRSNVKALTAEYDLSDDDQVMTDILAEVVKLENEGYQFEAAKASFALLMQRCAGTFNAHFEQVKYHVEVGAQEGKSVTNEATVKLRVAGEMQHMVAEGDGPVNALDAALRKALQDTYPTLESMRLVDYKVRVVNSEAGTAARTRVFIDCQDEHDIWGTVGVSENIIEASWIALVDAIEYKLYKDEQ
jgi:2-isopropylmalate synthase